MSSLARISLLLIAQTFACIVNAQEESSSELSSCTDQIGVAKCFIELLDDWAWNLWDMKTSLEAFTERSCEVHNKLKECVDYPGCTRADTIKISKIVTDLLHHRKDSGTFLRSYFAIEFACSEEGQRILHQHGECLHRFHFNDAILQEVRAFSKELKTVDSEQACERLTTIAGEQQDLALTACNDKQAAALVCYSVVKPFLQIHADTFADCSDICQITDESVSEDGVAPLNGAQMPQKPEPKSSGGPSKTGFAQSIARRCLVFAGLIILALEIHRI